jgi:integrase/recombinase XerC
MALVQRFLEYITYEKRYSVHTVRAYTDDLTSFIEFLTLDNDVALVSTTSADVRSWLLELANLNISPRSYKRKLSSVKAFYKFLLREKIIQKNPTDSVIMPKHQNPIPEFYSTRETSNLFEYIVFPSNIEGIRDKLILRIFYATGMRLSELVGLRIRDIDFSLKHIRVTGKRNKQRNIPVSDNLLNEIRKYIVERNIQSESSLNKEYLFLTLKGEVVYPRLVQRMVEKYFKQVTTSEKTNPHKLRHTFATHMLNNGADLNAVKELLGHASLAATEVYTHNTYEKLKSVYKQAHPRA